jgi:hypothetical protein
MSVTSRQVINFESFADVFDIATGQGARAEAEANRAESEANRIENTIQAVDMGDFIELFAIAPAELIETTVTVEGFEFNIIEIIQD